LFGIVGQAVYRENDADAPTAYGSIAKEGVRSVGNLFSYFRQFLRGYVVYVYNAQRSLALDMGLLLAARKSDGNGKARTWALFAGSCRQASLLMVVTVFLCMVAYGRVVLNLIDYTL